MNSGDNVSMQKNETAVLDDAADQVIPLIDEFVHINFNVIMANICTEDGFVIYHKNSDQCQLAGDKMAAIASTLSSIAEASVQSIATGKLKVIIVESETANLFIVHTAFHNTVAVLTVAISHKLSIGQSLFITNRLSAAINRAVKKPLIN